MKTAKKIPPYIGDWLALRDKIALGVYAPPISCILINEGRNEGAVLLDIEESEGGALCIKCEGKNIKVDGETKVTFKQGRDANGKTVFLTL